MLKVKVNSPDKSIWTNIPNIKKANNGDDIDTLDVIVEEIILDTDSGTIGIKDGHENLISTVVAGELQIILSQKSQDTNSSQSKSLERIGQSPVIFYISSGVLKVQTENNITSVNILLQEAENIEEINIQELEKAINRAKEILSENDDSDVLVSEQLIRDLSKIKVVRKYK